MWRLVLHHHLSLDKVNEVSLEQVYTANRALDVWFEAHAPKK